MPVTDSDSVLRRHALLWLGLAAFVAAIVFINPLRNMPLEDDWAYAWTVERLLDTGRFEAHQWAAANPVFPVYWGWFFAKLFGYSFTVLRVSTLALVVLGWVAFYQLAREHGLNNDLAGLLALAFFASPLVLRFSFNFMTDVPFMVSLIVALLIYGRAIRLESPLLMSFASLAAALSILTRQFGIALCGGVLLSWALDRRRKQRSALYLTGLVLPIAAGAWQLFYGSASTSFGMQYAKQAQLLYVTKPWHVLAAMPWRLTVILQYVAFFALPLVLIAAGALINELNRKRKRPQESVVSTTMSTSAILAACIGAGVLYGRVVEGRSLYMPYLPWNFEDLGEFSQCVRLALTLMTSVGAVLFARIFLLRYRRVPDGNEVSPSERLLDLVTLLLLALQMVFFKIGDEYLLVFLPYALIVVGRHVSETSRRAKTALAVACLAMLAGSGMWTRGLLEREEAYWAGAEALRKSGIAPQQIYGSWTWTTYHGFQDYLAGINYAAVADTADYWRRWLPQRRRSAEFVLADQSIQGDHETWEMVGEIPYRNGLLEERRVFVFKKKPPQ